MLLVLSNLHRFISLCKVNLYGLLPFSHRIILLILPSKYDKIWDILPLFCLVPSLLVAQPQESKKARRSNLEAGFEEGQDNKR